MPIRRWLSIMLLLCAGSVSGCALFPAKFHPGNLWKLNGHDPGGRESMYFSIPDPAPPAARTVRDE